MLLTAAYDALRGDGHMLAMGPMVGTDTLKQWLKYTDALAFLVVFDERRMNIRLQ